MYDIRIIFGNKTIKFVHILKDMNTRTFYLDIYDKRTMGYIFVSMNGNFQEENYFILQVIQPYTKNKANEKQTESQ